MTKGFLESGGKSEVHMGFCKNGAADVSTSDTHLVSGIGGGNLREVAKSPK
jgi:hypothetical protein